MLAGQTGTTQMSCTQSVDNQEYHYLALLASIDSYQLGEELLLRLVIWLTYVAHGGVLLQFPQWTSPRRNLLDNLE